MKRRIQLSRAILLFVVALDAPLIAGRPDAFAGPTAPPRSTVAASEPPAPAAAEAVQKRLDEASRLAATQQLEDAAQAAERAVEAAREAKDLGGEALAHAFRARLLERLGRMEGAIVAWQAAAAAWERHGDGVGRVEALAALGLLRAVQRPTETEPSIALAMALGRAETQRPRAAAKALCDAGWSGKRRGLLKPARELFAAAVSIQERAAPASLELARSLNGLGAVAEAEKSLPEAEGYFKSALELREKLAPQSMEVANSLTNLGLVAWQQGSRTAARDHHRRALAIEEAIQADSPEVAASLHFLGLIAKEQEDPAAAAAYLGRAANLREKWIPNSRELAESLLHLGDVTRLQGDLAAAKKHLQRARDLFDKLDPDCRDMAAVFNNLGLVAMDQGDLELAAEYCERALDMRQRPVPDVLSVVESLNNLGIVSQRQEDLPRAQAYLLQALDLGQKLAPHSREVADTLHGLGLIAHEQGDLPRAEQYYEEALRIRKEVNPASLYVAETLHNLGEVAMRRERPAKAKEYLLEALTLQKRLAPHSLYLAATLNNLGLLAQKQHDCEEAERLALEAWELVRRQAAAVTGDEARRAFAADTACYAANLVSAQICLKKLGPAFATLEEGRAQALRRLLFERQLEPKGVSEYREATRASNQAEQTYVRAKVEEARARRHLKGGHDQRLSEEELARRRTKAEEARRQLGTSRSAYTRARARLEELRDPVGETRPEFVIAPLDLDQAQQTLPRDALFAAFSVGEQQTDLFLVRSGEGERVQHYTVPLSEDTLRRRVAAIMSYFPRTRDERGSGLESTRDELMRESQALFRDLFPEAARRAVESARRLILSPDGPLWDLPFAILAIHPEEASQPRYLGVEKPITYAQSLSLFAESHLRKSRTPPGAQLSALVVGNPMLDRAARPSPGTALASRSNPASPARIIVEGSGKVAGPSRFATADRRISARRGARSDLFRDGITPPPLPWAEKEATEISALYGGPLLIRAAATEEAVRGRIEQAGIIHLATHGRFHPYWPMATGLLLATPEKEPPEGQTDRDGVLQAWEIYSQLKLRAELVVLSACETGRGGSVGSEGLIGLTRALQCAGARSIVASQWDVADPSTQVLMVEFHRNLREGVAKDEALRRAMAKLQKEAATAHPYYWGAFILIGDPENLRLGGRPPGARARS